METIGDIYIKNCWTVLCSFLLNLGEWKEAARDVPLGCGDRTERAAHACQVLLLTSDGQIN